MTAIRKSYLIARESAFGSGESADNKWYALPPGFYFSHTDSTSASSMYGTGGKLRQNTIYGPFRGSWNASFVMDYDHLEFLSMIFDVTDETYDATNTPEGANQTVSIGSTTCYKHTLRKINGYRQGSYVIKERILNTIANGEYNEVCTLKGVLASNLQMARAASGSQMAVEMSGMFADKSSTFDQEAGSFYVTPTDPLTQYSCMYLGTNETINDDDIIEQTDSHSISIDTGVSLVFSTCTNIAKDFFEANTTFSWNASTYSNNPTRKFRLLPNSGGTLDPKVGSALKDPDNGHHALQPMGKNLAPLEWVHFATYSESMRDQYHDVYASRAAAIAASTNSIIITAEKSTVKSITTQKGDGSKLQDSLSSVECNNLTITIVNDKPKIWANEATNTSFSPVTTTVVNKSFTQGSVTFTIPSQGYANGIIEHIQIPQSETALASTITLNGLNSEYPQTVKGYTLITDTTIKDSDNETRLDNLIPKDLTKGGTASLSGLTVSTTGSGANTYVTISGTPQIKRTDYYFLVKVDTSVTPNKTYSGYLRVDVI